MAASNSDLSDAALRLRNAAPDQFDHFLKVFQVYNYDVTVAVTVADQATVLQAQGRAQQTTALERLFRECTQRVKP